MKGENLIHLKFEYPEALKGKREILYSEKILIDLIGIIRRYNSSRMEELKLRLKLHRKTKELIAKMGQLQENFPHLDVAKILNKEEERNEEIRHPDNKLRIKRKEEPDNEIESQLRDIQRKLNAISKS